MWLLTGFRVSAIRILRHVITSTEIANWIIYAPVYIHPSARSQRRAPLMGFNCEKHQALPARRPTSRCACQQLHSSWLRTQVKRFFRTRSILPLTACRTVHVQTLYEQERSPETSRILGSSLTSKVTARLVSVKPTTTDDNVLIHNPPTESRSYKHCRPLTQLLPVSLLAFRPWCTSLAFFHVLVK